ncbi:DUF3592 domain-containing protein [Streptomyces sp. NPDC004042]|uniref:DUF3592 domain-containing protein n=1 Tax=Streptomyces sp. NPDC004042 TaxID=3154451 RepID=UPI0033A0C82D
METLFYVVPGLMACGALCALVMVTRRAGEIRRAWRDGPTAEARCLRVHLASGGGQTSAASHHVYEFSTPEGRVVRFTERGGPLTTVEGDIVTVRYPAGRPERATAHAPASGRLLAEQGCLCAFLGVFAAVCLAFMGVAHLAFAVAGDVLP